jgi:uncharacterized delta-60 repeat protein
MRRLAWTLSGLVLPCLSLPAWTIARPCAASDGDLDPTFGRLGGVIVDFAGQDDYVRGIAIQPDGKVIVVGQTGDYPLFHSALVRVDSTGELDDAFGIGGRVTAILDPGGDQLNAVALQPDGKIVCAGALIHDNWQTAFLVARFLPDGSPDPSFGDLGHVVTTFGDSSAAASAVVLQPDGKIVTVGFSGAGPYSELNDFALARYDASGSLDQTFGTNGKVLTHFPGISNTGSSATDVARQYDGKLVVAGYYKNEAMPREFALARYLENGGLDPDFGTQGKVTTSIGPGDALAMGIVLVPGDKIVLAGMSTAGHHNHDFALARYDKHGALDGTFGVGGLVTSDLFGTSDDIAYDVALQMDGKLIAVGRTGQYPNFQFGIARYDRRGNLDPTFGLSGRVATSFGGFSSQSYAAGLQPDGNLVVTGYVSNTDIDVVLARYLAAPHGPSYR